jgi:hypothetical protein
MAGTTDAQGDATRTAGSWANQMRALKSTLSEAATTIGTELLPFVTPLLQTIVEIATTALPPLLEGFKEIKGHFKDEFGPAIKEIIAAFREVFQALGLNTEGMDLLGLAIDGIKITITLAAEVFKAIARVIRDVASAVRTLVDAINWVIDKFNEMAEAARNAINAIPDWLVPGSPTPLELGFRGIGDAMEDVNRQMSGFGVGLSPQMQMGGQGAGGVVVNLTYAPAVSLADQYEAEQRLVPYIEAALAKRRR